MMRITAKTASGMNLCLDAPETLEFSREFGVPADSLALTFAGELPMELNTVRVTLDGHLLLDGVVDEIVLDRTGKGRRSRLYARSLAALLLDSECKPMTMQNPREGDVFFVTAGPLGFENMLSQNVYRGQYHVEKGTCLWSALADFVGIVSGAALMLRGRALYAFSLRKETPLKLPDGVLLSQRQTVKPCAGLGEVRYKTRPEEDYPWSKPGTRPGGPVRYVNLAEYPPWQWERRLEQSLHGDGAGYEAVLTLQGRRTGELGDRVLPGPALAAREPLYLSAIHLSLGAGGWQTKWRLSGARFFEEW